MRRERKSWGRQALATCCACVLTLRASASFLPADTAHASALLARARAFIEDARYDSATIVLRDLERLADSLRMPAWSARAWHAQGIVMGRAGDYQGQGVLFKRALRVFEEQHDTAMIAKTELDMGYGVKTLGRTSDALEHDLRALGLYEALRDTVGMALTLNNLASVYSDMGEHDAAGERLQRSFDLLTAAHRPEIRKTLTAMAQLAERRGDLAGSIAYTDQVIPLHRAAGDTRGEARALTYRSRARLKLGLKSEALADARAARALTQDPQYALEAVIAEGKALQALERDQEALAVFAEAEAMAMRLGNMGLVGMVQLREADLLSARGDHRAANEKLKLYMHLQDSCRVESSTREVTRMEMNLAFAKKELADSLANVEAVHLAERDHLASLAGERHRFNLLAIAGVSLLLLTVLLWSRLRYVRRTRDTILRTQRQLVESEKQHAAEQVRVRIARDVHDEIGSELTKIALLAARSRDQAATSEADAIGKLEEIVALSNKVGASLNDVVWSVDPRHDTRASMVMHAQHYTERLLHGQPGQHDLRFALNGPDGPLDPAVKRNIFLLLKEALNNALKYAGAERLRIHLDADTSRFDLLVQDDGIGFDPAALAHEGNGLRNMRARSQDLGATLRISASPGTGCAVSVSGPLG